MEFGFFAQGAVPAPLAKLNPRLEHERIMESLELAIRMEDFGFKYAWASEHHFLDEYSHMATPETFAAYVAARTERVHVGSAITNITPPVNHPARVAENVAMLDHITDGRYEFGTGRGSSTTEMGGFGIDDWDSTRDLWHEALVEIPKMWRQDSYAYAGDKFPAISERRIVPRMNLPLHPPMWVAAGNPETFEIAGRLGLGVLSFAFGPPKKSKIPAAVEAYKKAIENAEPAGDFVNNNIVCVTNMICTPNRDDAFELGSKVGMSYYHSLVLKWLDTFPHPEGVPTWPDLIPEPSPAGVEALGRSGAIVAGDPDDCVAGVEVYQDIGIDQVVFSPLTTQISYDDALSSFQLFGKEVLPQFDKDEEHSTTRYRRAAAGNAWPTS